MAALLSLSAGTIAPHAGQTAGAVRAAESIAAALGWERVYEPVTVVGAPDKQSRDACWELGATVAASVATA